MRRTLTTLAISPAVAAATATGASAGSFSPATTGTTLTGIVQKAVAEHPQDPATPEDLRVALRVGDRTGRSRRCVPARG